MYFYIVFNSIISISFKIVNLNPNHQRIL